MAEKRKGPRPREVGWIEWAVGGLGALITVAVLATLVHEALTASHPGPPVLVAKVVDVTPTEGGFVVRFTTENRGPATAANVMMSGRLKEGDKTLEEGEATLDYVARHSTREAGIVFRRDPATATIELEATSYTKP